MHSDTLELSCALIERASITPEDAGCQALIAGMLEGAGFSIRHMPYGMVQNLWAVHGTRGPLLCLLGHTDVVPPGPEQQWQSPPFVPTVREDKLYGRGAADMKGGVAAMVTAALRFVADHPRHDGRLAILLTSDEEGPARDGVRRVVQSLGEEGERIEWCLVGEPSCDRRFGDTIKNGRRGSLSATLTVEGTQGHIAYPHKADNPILSAVSFIDEFLKQDWGSGNEHFPPVSLQFSRLVSDGKAHNIIPGILHADFNFRYGDETSERELRAKTEALLDKHKLKYSLDWHASGEPFLTETGALLVATRNAVKAHTGIQPQLSTAGGTSDGRYIAPTRAQVVEFGALNETAHKIDEHVAIKDLESMTRIYQSVLEGLLAPGAPANKSGPGSADRKRSKPGLRH